jgi:hypothetical protein
LGMMIVSDLVGLGVFIIMFLQLSCILFKPSARSCLRQSCSCDVLIAGREVESNKARAYR